MPEFLSLDEMGRLEAATPAGRQWLAGRSGRWRILPTADDLVLLRRDAVTGDARGVRAVLAGDLSGFAFGELVSFLAQSRFTGVLTVARANQERSVFLRQGTVRWAASNRPEDRLGEILLRLGLVDEAHLQRALAAGAAGGGPLGQALLAAGVLTPADLYRALRHQIEEIFFSALSLEDGLFFLFNDPVESRFPAQISLELNGLLMDGLRRIDELSHFRKRIPHGDVHVARRDRVPEGLQPDEQAAWDAVDGRRTVRQIATAAHLPEFEATKVLFGLAQAGFVEISAERPAPVLGRAAPPSQPEAREVARVFNVVFREIWEEIGRVAPTAGFRFGVDTFLGSDQHRLSGLFAGLTLDEEGQLPEDVLLERLPSVAAARGQSPARVLYEALNELMFFELFQAGEVLPPDRDEDLSRRVRMIYEMLEH